MPDEKKNVTTVFRADVSQFKKNIADATAAIKLADAGFEAATAGMDDFTKSSDGLEAKIKHLSDVMAAQNKMLENYRAQLVAVQAAKKKNTTQAEELRKAMADMAKAGKENTSEYKSYAKQLAALEKEIAKNEKAETEYETKMLKTQAAVKKSEKAVEAYKSELDGLEDGSERAEKASDDLGSSTKDAGKAAEAAQEGFTVLKGVLANLASEAIIGGIKAIGSAIGDAAKAAVEMGEAAAGYADNILTLSTNTGIATDDLQAYSAVAELVDVSMDTLTGSMSRNVRAMGEAASGSASYAEAYAKLGVAVTDANGNLRDSEEVYWECIDALGGIANETERDALAMEIFGKSAQDLNSLVAQGSEGFAALKEEAISMGAVLSEDTLSTLGELDDAMQKVTSVGSATTNIMGGALAPMMTEVYNGMYGVGRMFNQTLNEILSGGEGDPESMAEFMFDIINGFADNLPALAETGGKVISTIAESIAIAAPMLVETFEEVLPQIVDAFSSGLGDLVPVMTEIVKTLVAALGPLLGQLIAAGMEILMAVIQGIVQALPELVPVVLDIANTLVSLLIENIPVLIDAAVQLFMALVDAIPVFLTQLVPQIPVIVTTIITSLLAAFPQLLEGAVQLLMALVDAIPVIINELILALPTIVEAIVQTLLQSLPIILDAGVQLLFGLIAAIPQFIPALVEALPQIITALIAGLLGAIPMLVEAGANLIGGLIEGMLGSIGRLGQAIANIGKRVVDGLKSFFGINSPSRLLRDEIGKYLPDGIAVGVEANATTAIKSVRKLGADLVKNIDVSGVADKLAVIKDGLSGGALKVSAETSTVQAYNGAGNTTTNNNNSSKSVTFAPTYHYNKPLNAKEVYRQDQKMLRKIVGVEK